MNCFFKNKLSFVFIVFSMGFLLLNACTKEPPEGVPDHTKEMTAAIKDIKDVYQYYHSDEVPLALDEGFEKILINGIVISDAAAGNIPEGYFMIQDKTGGIVLLLNDPTAELPFVQGDSVAVNVIDGLLSKVNGNFVIKNLDPDDITKVGEGSIKPVAVTLKQLSENFETYNERLVKIIMAELVPEPAEGETYSGEKVLSDGTTTPGDIVLYTLPSSGLAQVEAAENATYAGIALYGKNEEGKQQMQILLRNEQDISKTKLIPVNAPIVITGFLTNPRGSDEKVKGDKTSYSGSTGVTIIHKGGYEYIQLMALKDIDFSKTPYSVVTANNGTATEKGWAEGGNRTFKFNLTEGFAEQGTFFYVGATAKVICAYWPEGLSTDISDANWIRSIPVKLKGGGLAGDGFGNSTGGLLGNSSSADGIAVFEGTEVTSSSVPVDAVFFNPPAKGALDNGNGYLIPANDLYNPVNPETGEPQPLFGQGSNTFAVEDAGKSNRFVLMGGMVSKKAWLVPRKPVTKELSRTSVLSEIETGKGVTVFRK